MQEPGYLFYSPQRDTHAQITIRDGTVGLVVEKPTSDLVHGGGVVIWWIDNQSNLPHRVDVTNFRPKGSREAEWPFQDPPAPPVTVPPGAFGRIRLRTLDRGPYGKKGTWVYEYDVVVDDQAREPEVVIEWP